MDRDGGLAASLLAAATATLLTRGGPLHLLGWALFFESLQLPLIAEARHGGLDPCTARIRRLLAGRRGSA